MRKHPGGLCSGQLMALEPGDAVLPPSSAAIPAFHAGRGRAPLILIGAGTGIGPLAGFVRANAGRRPMHLFFGMRHPDSDFLYGDELSRWQSEAGSRTRHRHLARRAAALRAGRAAGRSAPVTRLIREGARVMVCGGRDMAARRCRCAGRHPRTRGPDARGLKAEGRYVEDVY